MNGERQRRMFNQIFGGVANATARVSGPNCEQFGLIWAANNDGNCQSQV